jgi:hypothetical protein
MLNSASMVLDGKLSHRFPAISTPEVSGLVAMMTSLLA